MLDDVGVAEHVEVFFQLAALGRRACAEPIDDRLEHVFAAGGDDRFDAVAGREQRRAVDAGERAEAAERLFHLRTAGDAETLAHLDGGGAVVDADQEEGHARLPHAGECRMQNAECRSRLHSHSAFCILPSAFIRGESPTSPPRSR